MLLTAFTYLTAFFCLSAGFLWFFMFFNSWVRFASSIFVSTGLLIILIDAPFLTVAVAFIIGLGVIQYTTTHGGLDAFLEYKRNRDQQTKP